MPDKLNSGEHLAKALQDLLDANERLELALKPFPRCKPHNIVNAIQDAESALSIIEASQIE